MAQDRQGQDEAGNIWELDAQGNPVRLIRQAGQQIAPPAYSIPSNPEIVARKRAAEQRAAAASARADQAAALAQEKAQRDALEWQAMHNPDGSPKPVANKNGSAELTAATRANAINAFTATRQLDNLIAGIESQYKGIEGYQNSGLTRFPGVNGNLGTEANRKFDSAGNAVRGAAITALGFTSGQTNTPREVEQNIGPYIPNASDYDSVIIDKIARLKELRDRARVQAVTVLGGVPSADGSITPLSKVPQQERDQLFPPGTMQPTIPGALGGSPGDGGDGQPPTGPRGEKLLGADEQVSFGGDGRPLVGYRFTPAQQNEITRRVLSGDIQGGVNLASQVSGGKSGIDAATARSVYKYAQEHPGWVPNWDASGVDKAAQSQADEKRYGGQLPAALIERENAGNVDAGLRAGANGLTAGLADYASGAVNTLANGGSFQENLLRQQALSEADSRQRAWTIIPQIAGGAIGATLGEAAAAKLLPGRFAAAAPVVGDALYGGTAAATSQNDISAAVPGALAGVAGGVAGRNTVRAAGNTLRGARNASVDLLRSRGVPVTVGQLLGGNGRVGAMIKGAEDRLSGVPVIGDMVNARRLEGLQGFNRAAFNEGLAPVGGTTNGLTQEAGVEAAQDVVGNAYGTALNGVRVQADAPFVSDMSAALARGRGLPEPMAGRADYTLNTRVGNSFDQTGGLTGRDFQQAMRGLRQDASAVRSEPYGNDFGEVTQDAGTALEGMLTRQAPDVLPAYNAANSAYRRTEVLRDAVNRARNGARTGQTGIFAPSQLADAAAANARRFGNSQGTTRQPFFDLSRAGQDTLPSSVPDSGTAGRLAALALPSALGGAAGGGIGYAGGDTQTGLASGLAVGGLLSAGGSRAIQQGLVRLLADRPDAAIRLGEQINRRARLGGVFGAPLLADYMGQ